MASLDRSSDAAALAGVSELLWPGATADVGRARPGPHDYVVLPSLARPRLVVPAAHAPTAGLVLGHGGAGHHPARIRLRELGARVVARSGITRALPVPRVAGSGPTWLLDEVRAMVPEAAGLGLRLGTVRPNRKPVALVADRHGRLVAVGKIGWSPLTRELVDTIDRRLTGVGDVPDLVLPRPLGRSETDAHLVHWQTPLPVSRSKAPTSQVLGDGLLAISRLGPVAGGALADLPWTQTLVAGARSATRGRTATVIQRMIDRHADVVLATGTFHGDFTAWNVAQVGNRLAVWDWERTADDVPVGIDAAHYHLTLSALAATGDAELRRATEAARPLLGHLGVEGRAVEAIRDLHLADLVLRLDDHAPAAPLVETMLDLLDPAAP